MNGHPPFPTLPSLEPYKPLLRLFEGLPRRGPGSEASTLRALAFCPLPPDPVVADLGCGSGASTLVLARELKVPVRAVDGDGLALDTLWRLAEAQGLLPLVQPHCADLRDPGIPPASLDLLWAEGSIGHLGWEVGLPLWRDGVRPGGLLALTDAVWLTENPPEEARALWDPEYPTMGTLAQNLDIARRAGLGCLNHFVLPPEDWRAYFGPVLDRMAGLGEDPALAEVAAGLRHEADVYDRCQASYGYVFFILRRD